MDFLKKRVIQYQEKKLDEALSKVKFHSEMKQDIQYRIKKQNIDPNNADIKKEISFHQEMIEIWTKNSKKIQKEIKKLER